MSALTHEFDLAQATMLPERQGAQTPDPAEMAEQWQALHAAGSAIAALAQLAPEKRSAAVRSFPDRAALCGGEAHQTAVIGVADLVSIMLPGLRALLAMTTGGRDATGAALALWQEFQMARDAILSLVPQDDCPMPA